MDINLNYRDEFIELVTPIIENEKVKRMDKYIHTAWYNKYFGSLHRSSLC